MHIQAGIYMLTDTPGQTSGKAEELFRPVSKQQEYCISPLCVDKDGTIYYKNDSCYLMALETNGAYLDSVTARPGYRQCKLGQEISGFRDGIYTQSCRECK